MTLSRERAFDRLALPGGGFAMVAIDQRESLRSILADRPRASPEVTDGELTEFKLAVAAALAPLASAMLFDVGYGLPALARTREHHSGCGIILAGDQLEQQPGGSVTDTSIDPAVRPEDAQAHGAVAMKLLLIWTGERTRNERCLAVAREFMLRCRSAGLLGIIEGVVKPPTDDGSRWDREAQLHAAAAALGACDPDIYKCEVPHYGRAHPDQIERDCARITDVLNCPWVILSSGVAPADFPVAVEAACRGGASGFLAGRAIWADAAGAVDYRTLLRTESTARLAELVEIVGATATPWRDRQLH